MATSDSAAPNLFRETLAAAAIDRRAISRKQFQRAMTVCEVSADLLTCFASIFAAYYLYLALHIGRQLQYSARDVAAAGFVIGLLTVILLQRDGAYRGSSSMLQIRETERAFRIPAQSLLLLLPFSFLLNLSFSRAAFLIALVLMPSHLILQKRIFASIVQMLRAKGYGVDRVAIYGAGDTGRRILSTLLCSPRLGLRPVAVIDDNPVLAGSWLFPMGYKRDCAARVHLGPVSPSLLASCHVEMLIVAIPGLSAERLREAAQAAGQSGIRVAFIPAPETEACQLAESIDIDGLILTSVVDRVEPWGYAIAKRTADLFLASIFLVVLAPLLCLIALLIRLNSPGAAIFVQKRAGLNGRLFDMYKFRSMHSDVAKYDLSPTTSLDGRITSLGRLLRRSSLDELPQLINVLLGHMSLVGPRPEMPFIVEGYNARHKERLRVIPGITGLWQLSADRTAQIHDNIQYDLYYVRYRSFSMDTAILIHTLFFAMRGV